MTFKNIEIISTVSKTFLGAPKLPMIHNFIKIDLAILNTVYRIAYITWTYIVDCRSINFLTFIIHSCERQ